MGEETGKSLEQLDTRAIWLMVCYDHDPKKLALVAAGLEVDRDTLRASIDKMYEVIKEQGDYITKTAQDTIAHNNTLSALRAELAAAREDAERLAGELAKVEWVIDTSEDTYCPWCHGDEPGPRPAREDYSDDWTDCYNSLVMMWEGRGHKPDCPRQIALAAHNLTKS